MALSTHEIEKLVAAKHLLENPGLVVKITNRLGFPLEKGIGMLPESWHLAVDNASRKAIETAMDGALRTLRPGGPNDHPSNRWHKWAVGTSGAVGGAFGITTLMIELPISTTIMLRSIADIARSQGEDLSTPEARLQCVQVFAMGGRSGDDDSAETSYFTVRSAMAKIVSDAAAHLSKKGFAVKGSPVMVRFISRIASRFSMVVSEKAVVQALPVVGALSGTVINTLFMDHFQDMGKGHFTVRRLERLHGKETVRQLYETL